MVGEDICNTCRQTKDLYIEYVSNFYLRIKRDKLKNGPKTQKGI